jgi:hypothetical protein
MTERRVADIVRERGRLGRVGVELHAGVVRSRLQHLSDAPRNLCHL